MTAMPMLVAEELDVDWNKVTTEWAPADSPLRQSELRRLADDRRQQQHPRHVEDPAQRRRRRRARCSSPPRRRPGTSPRAALHDREGRGRSIRPATAALKYGALVDKAAALPVPATVALKDPKALPVLGQDARALRHPDEGERHGRVRHRRQAAGHARRRASCAARCSAARSPASTPTRPRRSPACSTSSRSARGIAVVADGYWAASRGAQALEVKWDEGPLATLNSADDHEALRRRWRSKPGKVARNDGDADTAIAACSRARSSACSRRRSSRTRCMEPMNCTADVQRRSAATSGCRRRRRRRRTQAAMAATGLPESKVFVHTTYLGGGFGRRGEADFVIDAVETSKAVGAPVKVIWIARGRHPARLLPSGHLRRGCGAALDAHGQPSRLEAAPRPAVAAEARRPARSTRCRVSTCISRRWRGEPAVRHPEHPRRVHRGRSRASRIGFWRSVGSSVQRLRHRGVHRRAGDDGREGSVSVPPRAAGEGTRGTGRCSI